MCSPAAAGNASPISDGAAAVVLASASAVRQYGLPVLGRKIWHWNVFRIPEEAPRKPEEVSAETDPVEPLLEAAQ